MGSLASIVTRSVPTLRDYSLPHQMAGGTLAWGAMLLWALFIGAFSLDDRIKSTRFDGRYVDYTYDNIGQLKTALGMKSGGASLIHKGVPGGDKSPCVARKLRVEYPGAIYYLRNHGGAEPTEIEMAKAERVLREELERRVWNAAELERRRKGDSQKIQVAQRLRTETTMTWNWINDHLRMGAGVSAANRLRRG